MTSTNGANILFQESIFSLFLGKPSNKYFPLNYLLNNSLYIYILYTFFINLTTKSEGTNFPDDIISYNSYCKGPSFFYSALNKSPVDKCVYWNYLEILEHCVPLPDPGPPFK